MFVIMMGGTNQPTRFAIPPGEKVGDLSEEAKIGLQKLAEFASWPKNWYRPYRGGELPGESKDFTRIVQIIEVESGHKFLYQVVFTHSKVSEDAPPLRHMSISVRGEDGKSYQPSIAICQCLGQALGFTGGIETWAGAVHPTHSTLVFAQEI